MKLSIEGGGALDAARDAPRITRALRRIGLVLAFALLPGLASGETILLKDGSQIAGKILSVSQDEVILHTPDGILKIKLERIKEIDYSSRQKQILAEPPVDVSEVKVASAPAKVGGDLQPTPRSSADHDRPPPSRLTGNLNILLGAKSLDEDDWSPVHEHREAAMQFDFRGLRWPFNLSIEYAGSASDKENAVIFVPGYGLVAFQVEAETNEINLGLKKIWDKFPHFRPYIGAGPSIITGKLTLEGNGRSVSDKDTSSGFWIAGGLSWTIERFNIGFEAKLSTAEIEVFGVKANAGGGHFGLFAGLHF